MDLSRIFLKDACPTKVGGQAIMEGVMMRGESRVAVAVRVPDGRIHIKTEPVGKMGSWARLPIIRGVVSFVSSLVVGMRTLLYSADVLEAYTDDEAKTGEPGRFETWLAKKFGAKAAWNFAIFMAVIMALVMTVVIFILMPTVVINLLGKVTDNAVLLNLAEGIFRILIFVLYIVAISKMGDIKRTFMYHGAEHKTIHCFENGLEMTPENAQQFYRLHPRCGTSFLVFVMVISLLVFSLMGWPTLWMRLLSRVVLIPVVAGLSYEVLRWAGRSDNVVVRILSLPGLYLQKITTAEPTDDMLEVAIASMKAATAPADTPFIEGVCDKDGKLVEERRIRSTSEDER